MTTKNPYTLAELKRQKGFTQTMIARAEEKHRAAQAVKYAKLAKVEKAIAEAEALESMDTE